MSLPAGFRIALAPATRRFDAGRRLLGGRPLRVLTLSATGARLLDELLEQGVRSAAGGQLAGRLLAADLAVATPQPASRVDLIAVMVPAHDRAAALDRTLQSLSAWCRRVLVVDDGSDDPATVAATAERWGASVHRRPVAGGPAAARNTGLALLADIWPDSAIVGFVDSDCRMDAATAAGLAGHFADPQVVASAPRVRPAATDRSLLARYLAVRSPLDMGPGSANVRPDGTVRYLPATALFVRRPALTAIGGYDEGLRYGEDVDLVWRLHDAGGSIRYDARLHAAHEEPDSWRAILVRRARYGTSAGPLARRHGDRLAPARVMPAAASVATLALAGRAVSVAGAAVVAGATVGRSARGLRGHGVPLPVAAAVAGAGLVASVAGLGRSLTQLCGPAVLVAAAVRPRRMWPVLGLLAAEPVAAWVRGRPAVDPLRWVAASIADDIAYGCGVWWGAARAGTVTPLRPRLSPPASRPSSGRQQPQPAAAAG